MSYELEGKLHKKYDTESKTESFKAREFVVEVADGQYPQFVKLQLTQDRCAMLDPFEEGHNVKVHFDLRGREWNGKYFTNLNAWRLEKADESAPPPPDSGGGYFPEATDEPSTSESHDDLPF